MQELFDMNDSVVVLIKPATNFCDVVDVAYFILVDIEQKAYKFVPRNVHVLLAQGHKRHDERVLLLDFVDEHDL